MSGWAETEGAGGLDVGAGDAASVVFFLELCNKVKFNRHTVLIIESRAPISARVIVSK